MKRIKMGYNEAAKIVDKAIEPQTKALIDTACVEARKSFRDSLLQADIEPTDDDQIFTLKFTKELLIELLGEKALDDKLKATNQEKSIDE